MNKTNSIKSIVKVMNLHSLLRVDKSRTKSKKFMEMEAVLYEMIESILYNRNLLLDYKTLRPDKKKPQLNIYIGSDMGFCASITSKVKKPLSEDSKNTQIKQILIGRKLLSGYSGEPLLYMTREAFEKDDTPVLDMIEKGVRELEYSSITITYNEFENTSNISFVTKQIFPLEEPEDKPMFRDDFVLEGDPDVLLSKLVVLYAKYTMYIAGATSFAAENISRQNVTNESLRKIEEREELQLQEVRRVEKEKQFAKVLENFTRAKA